MRNYQLLAITAASIGLVALCSSAKDAQHEPLTASRTAQPHRVVARAEHRRTVVEQAREVEQARPRAPHQQAELTGASITRRSVQSHASLDRQLADQALLAADRKQRLRALGKLASRIDRLPEFRSRLLDRMALVEPAEALVIAIVLRQSRDLTTHRQFLAARRSLPERTRALFRRALP